MKQSPPRAAGRHLAPLAITALLALGAGMAAFGAPGNSTLLRSLQLLVLGALLASLGRIGAALTRCLAPGLGRWSTPVFALTFATAFAVVSATWLGHCGLLRPAPFLTWTAVAHLLALRLPLPAPPERDGAEAGSLPPPLSRRGERVLLASAFVAVLLAGVFDFRNSLYAPPGPHGFDDISYHLSTVAVWARHGDLRMIRFAMGDPATSFYPVDGELASWVLLAPFGDSDFVARWSQLPFALFSLLAVAAIARRLGLAERQAALAALAYASLHQVFPLLANGAGNDHATGFFALAALDGALAFARRPAPGLGAATGVALGMLVGTKYIGVLFVPVLAGALALLLWAERRRQGEGGTGAGRRGAAAGLGLLVLAALLTGGYTYLRNWATAGNPVFPAPVSLLGAEVFPGWDSARMEARREHAEAEIAPWPFLTARPELFGHLFPYTLLPAALLAPVVALARRRFREAAVFTLPAVFFLQFLYQMHDHRHLRYFLPGLAIAAVALAWLLRGEGKIHAGLRLALLAGLFLQVSGRLDGGGGRALLWFIAALAAGFGLELAAGRRDGEESGARAPLPQGRRRLGAAAAALLLLGVPALGRTVQRYQEVKLDRRPAERALELLAGPSGARVAYAGFNQPYLFFGGRLQNDLQFVPRNVHLDAQYYDWGSAVANPYSNAGYRRWRANLETLRIELLVVILAEGSSPEERWARQHEGDFDLAYGDGKVEIWKVVPERSGGAVAPGEV